MKTSITITIKRSQINFAPYNPRIEDENLVKKLLSNFKKVGFMGGIQWNELTGNLVGGHKRVMAHDMYYKYDGTNDYDIKVEKVSLSEKEEKEQNIFLNKVQGNFDKEKLFSLMSGIDPLNAGYTQDEIKTLEAMTNVHTVEEREIPDIPMLDIEAIERVKQAKEMQASMAIQRQIEANKYIVIKFPTSEDKAYFCEEYGLNFDAQSVDIDELINKLNI